MPERQKRLEDIGFSWDTNISAWETKFLALSKFKEQHKHCNVPQRYSANPKLATWVGTQRIDYSDKRMPQERIIKLESLGFQWNPSEIAWETMFALLCDYKKENGDCNVPPKFKEKKLRVWVIHLRASYKKKSLSDLRIKKLREIGFILDPLESQWEQRYTELLDFKKEYGHCNVPKTYAKNRKLGAWVANLRRRIEEQSESRIKKLNAIGFV